MIFKILFDTTVQLWYVIREPISTRWLVPSLLLIFKEECQINFVEDLSKALDALANKRPSSEIIHFLALAVLGLVGYGVVKTVDNYGNYQAANVPGEQANGEGSPADETKTTPDEENKPARERKSAKKAESADQKDEAK